MQVLKITVSSNYDTIITDDPSYRVVIRSIIKKKEKIVSIQDVILLDF